MSDLSDLQLDADVEQDDSDFLGGYQVKETGLYPMEIDLAYMGESSGGAKSLNLVFKNGREEYKETIYITSGKKKGQRPYYIDKTTGEKRPLPGMSMANAITYLTLGKQIHELDVEPKVIKLYDFEQGKEIDTKVQVIMDLLGEEIVLGIRKQIEDKNVKNDDGDYVPSGETREVNEIAKVFRASDNKTVSEAKAGADAEFMQKWHAKNAGVTIDKSTVKKGASGISSGAPAASNSAAPAKLF
jgi:hypothetical protein